MCHEEVHVALIPGIGDNAYEVNNFPPHGRKKIDRESILACINQLVKTGAAVIP